MHISECTALTAMICAEWLTEAYHNTAAGMDDFNEIHGGSYEVRSYLLKLAPLLDAAWATLSGADDLLDGVSFDFEFVYSILDDMRAEFAARILIEGDEYTDSPFMSATQDSVTQRARSLFMEMPEKSKAAALDEVFKALDAVSILSRIHILNTLQVHDEFGRWKRSQSSDIAASEITT